MSEPVPVKNAVPDHTSADADAALRFVGSHIPPMPKGDEERLVRRIDLFLIPLLCKIDSILGSLQCFVANNIVWGGMKK